MGQVDHEPAIGLTRDDACVIVALTFAFSGERCAVQQHHHLHVAHRGPLWIDQGAGQADLLVIVEPVGTGLHQGWLARKHHE